MRLIVGITVAPRPKPTYQDCVASLTGMDNEPILFAEPGCCIDRRKYFVVQRPDFETTVMPFRFGPGREFGNFQNWIQAGRDLLEIDSDADTFLIAEDDALFTHGIRSLLERDLWPSRRCGCVSLYTPAMGQYPTGNGLFETQIRHNRSRIVSTRNNLVGALALVFPRQVLQRLVYDKSLEHWKGSHEQARNADTKPWERKAVDTWIGRTLIELGYEIWSYSPSLVLHWSPLPDGESNSSLGHDAPRGQQSARQARHWIGANPGNLTDIYPQRSERYDIDLHPSSK